MGKSDVVPASVLIRILDILYLRKVHPISPESMNRICRSAAKPQSKKDRTAKYAKDAKMRKFGLLFFAYLAYFAVQFFGRSSQPANNFGYCSAEKEKT